MSKRNTEALRTDIWGIIVDGRHASESATNTTDRIMAAFDRHLVAESAAPPRHRCVGFRPEVTGETSDDPDACDAEAETNVRCAPGTCALDGPVGRLMAGPKMTEHLQVTAFVASRPPMFTTKEPPDFRPARRLNPGESAVPPKEPK